MNLNLYVTPAEFSVIHRLASDANAEDDARGLPQGSAGDLEHRPAAKRYLDHMRSKHGCAVGLTYDVVVVKPGLPAANAAQHEIALHRLTRFAAMNSQPEIGSDRWWRNEWRNAKARAHLAIAHGLDVPAFVWASMLGALRREQPDQETKEHIKAWVVFAIGQPWVDSDSGVPAQIGAGA